MKTLVAPAHDPNSHENGYDGCHARMSAGGCCPGASTARWLNKLGDDDAQFENTHNTNGEVRANYLRHNMHVVAVQPELARLQQLRVNLQCELAQVERDIERVTIK